MTTEEFAQPSLSPSPSRPCEGCVLEALQLIQTHFEVIVFAALSAFSCDGRISRHQSPPRINRRNVPRRLVGDYFLKLHQNKTKIIEHIIKSLLCAIYAISLSTHRIAVITTPHNVHHALSQIRTHPFTPLRCIQYGGRKKSCPRRLNPVTTTILQ